ncbi:inorganic phosphate transporter [Haliovirga abyssi]|uniref:Phosphate transporter n=1 Tax=Haliovirga abyssi TaxID=2996794 RepID=A0AAU9DU77_9FUSO|nr:inorganic phosphate transporter [Haliovirga abyssi]BDU50814.1 phosphate transporter [Haliovirga abyssi]
MSSMTIILGIALIVGFYMAWNIGANDVANAMGTSVGSKAITLKQAVIIAAIFEFLGAVLAGSNVTNTVRKGIVSPDVFTDPKIFVIGMLAALLAAGLWLNLATHFGLPVSTTHSIVGSVVGFGIVSKGIGAVHWSKIGNIVLSWVVSPLMGGIIALIVFKIIERTILEKDKPVERAKKIAPLFVGMTGFILTLSLVFKGLKNLHLDLSFGEASLIGTGVAIVIYIISFVLLRNVHSKGDEYKSVEGIFRYLQIITACYVAFAHGANDVANAIGPLAGIVAVVKTGSIATTAAVPMWVLALGGVGIVVGVATMGYKVIGTIGEKITELTPTRGFSAEFGAATTVLVASRMGLPISTTHTLIGAVIGVALGRGVAALNMAIVKDIVASWLITIPFAAGLTMVLFEIFKLIF